MHCSTKRKTVRNVKFFMHSTVYTVPVYWELLVNYEDFHRSRVQFYQQHACYYSFYNSQFMVAMHTTEKVCSFHCMSVWLLLYECVATTVWVRG